MYTHMVNVSKKTSHISFNLLQANEVHAKTEQTIEGVSDDTVFTSHDGELSGMSFLNDIDHVANQEILKKGGADCIRI